LEDVENFMANIVKATTKKEVMSIFAYGYVFSDSILSYIIHAFGIKKDF